MARDHQQDIADYQQEANTGKGPAAEYAKAVLPDLRKHLEVALRWQGQQQVAKNGEAPKSRQQ